MTRPIAAPALLLAGIYTAALFAGFLSPGSPAWQDRRFPGAPPMRPHFVDASGVFHFRPFVYEWEGSPDKPQGYREYALPIPIRFFVRGEPYSIAGVADTDLHLFGVAAPRTLHALGTDSYGRDVLARLLFGGQMSLLGGLVGTAISLSLAVVLGGCSGYFGGLIDGILMRAVDLLLAVPWMYLLFAVRAILPLHLESSRAFLLLIAIIGAAGCARPARLIRGVTLRARERGWVAAARAFGASDGWLLRKHVLPETHSVVFTQAAILAPQFVLAEVTLSFLGLGAGEPLPSWGGMLASAAGSDLMAGRWWLLSPGLALTVFCWACFALASALRDTPRNVS